jgi:hypothetical protein
VRCAVISYSCDRTINSSIYGPPYQYACWLVGRWPGTMQPQVSVRHFALREEHKTHTHLRAALLYVCIEGVCTHSVTSLDGICMRRTQGWRHCASEMHAVAVAGNACPLLHNQMHRRSAKQDLIRIGIWLRRDFLGN